MLTDEQRKDVARFAGKRFPIKYVIRTLRLADPQAPDYPSMYKEVEKLVNRETEISIRVTDSELEELKSRAGKTGRKRMADFIREAALGVEIKTPPAVQMVENNQTDLELSTCLRHLNRISHSINQVALKLNTQDKYHLIDDDTVAQYRQQIDRLLTALKSLEVRK